MKIILMLGSYGGNDGGYSHGGGGDGGNNVSLNLHLFAVTRKMFQVSTLFYFL
jgi:hypothetical protein